LNHIVHLNSIDNHLVSIPIFSLPFFQSLAESPIASTYYPIYGFPCCFDKPGHNIAGNQNTNLPEAGITYQPASCMPSH